MTINRELLNSKKLLDSNGGLCVVATAFFKPKDSGFLFMATSFKWLRTLGASEQYFWLSNQNSAKHFVIATEIVGDATVEAWVSAVAAAQLRHPLLRVSVDYAPFRFRYGSFLKVSSLRGR